MVSSLPPDPISVQPVTETQPRANSSYSLQCVGAEEDSDIQWTKNGEALISSVRVHLNDNNDVLAFDPLSQSDTGSYQCIVTEQGRVIPAIPYELNVICKFMKMHAVVLYSIVQ